MHRRIKNAFDEFLYLFIGRGTNRTKNKNYNKSIHYNGRMTRCYIYFVVLSPDLFHLFAFQNCKLLRAVARMDGRQYDNLLQSTHFLFSNSSAINK